MILPNKHLSTKRSLLGAGVIVLEHLSRGISVTSLWENIRSFPEIRTFDRFVLTLDMLFAFDLITFQDGSVRRINK